MQDVSFQVLLVRRGKEPQKGMLTFPGGRLELGETMAECAMRETLEETGLRLRNKGNLGRHDKEELLSLSMSSSKCLQMLEWRGPEPKLCRTKYLTQIPGLP